MAQWVLDVIRLLLYRKVTKLRNLMHCLNSLGANRNEIEIRSSGD